MEEEAKGTCSAFGLARVAISANDDGLEIPLSAANPGKTIVEFCCKTQESSENP